MSAMLSWLASLLTAPLLNSALDAWKARLAAGNDAERIAADLAAREIALQGREAELHAQLRIAELGRWYEPDKLMGYAVAIYFGKLLVIDKVMGWGTTDPLAGFAESTANLIVAFHFAKRGFENIARIVRR